MYFFFSFLSCLYDDFPWEEDWADNCDEDHSVLFFFHVKETLVVLEDSPMRTWRGWCCYRLLIILLLLCVLGLCARRRVLFFFSWGRWIPIVSLWARRGNFGFLSSRFKWRGFLETTETSLDDDSTHEQVGSTTVWISCCGSPQNRVFVFFPPELNFAVKIAVQNEVGEGVVNRLESVCVNRPSVR